MPVDYSKWDKIELSDDSDVEVHPNVDKRSFIRAKQRQIHEARDARRRQIKQITLEREINFALLGRLDRLLSALRAQESGEDVEKNPEEVLLRTLVEVSSAETEDRPKGEVDSGFTYGKMIGTLVDQVKKEVDTEKGELKGRERFRAFLDVIARHRGKIEGLNGEAAKKLAELEKEEKSKITSESIHDGFNAGSVNKSHEDKKPEAPKPAAGKKKVETVEQLNPGVKSPAVEAPGPSDDDVEATPLAKQFTKISIGNYNQLASFIRAHPHITAERETDGLLVEAFNSEIAGKADYARTCVHHALLLQYCRQIGPSGLRLFFERIGQQGHQAQKVFFDDVNKTYTRIKGRAKEIAKERDQEVEQIQLHAVEPGTVINIQIPPADSKEEETQKARKIFEGFKPELKKALESGQLDEVNKVLGKMSVPEAEEVVALLSEAGMLSLESEIIDATTEEGKQQVKALEEEAKKKKEVVYQGPEGDNLDEGDEEDVEEVVREPLPGSSRAEQVD